MRKYLFSALFFAMLMNCSGYAQATDTKGEEENASATVDVAAGESLVPDSTAMTLGMASQEHVMPANFRGGDPDSSVVNVLEDVYYEKHEHSLIYAGDSSELASGSSYTSEPNITWTTSKKDDNGDYNTISSNNTNMAADGGTLYTPGDYHIGNSGARQVSSAAKVENITDEMAEDLDNVASGSKTVTANQTLGVIVHDCTPPDVWIAFQEGAGNIDMTTNETELKQKLYTKIVESKGRPFSENAADFDEASYLFVDEGKSNERDLEPWNKVGRVSVAGALFDADGAIKFGTGTVPTALIDKDTQTRQLHIQGGTDDSTVKGIFVRKNVPFVFTAISIDNGDERKAPTAATCRIENADNSVVEKTDSAYLFRVPNYPRADYADQPEYFFVAKAVDKAGNTTTVRIPLYVVNTTASFEKSGN